MGAAASANLTAFFIRASSFGPKRPANMNSSSVFCLRVAPAALLKGELVRTRQIAKIELPPVRRRPASPRSPPRGVFRRSASRRGAASVPPDGRRSSSAILDAATSRQQARENLLPLGTDASENEGEELLRLGVLLLEKGNDVVSTRDRCQFHGTPPFPPSCLVQRACLGPHGRGVDVVRDPADCRSDEASAGVGVVRSSRDLTRTKL